ncbi:hypothetical protein K788_00003505 [Paraburkholderia caribensis MBA4]|uniref:Uncharacterized protein n=1 Tax=Paraburkholderia caribensis MBA4 TaxID=1323664 RepID=A0A0P0RI89_9BURK|nr:hypothetical protein K788_00003505 [Paraburkholderia caribensis MBA4]
MRNKACRQMLEAVVVVLFALLQLVWFQTETSGFD